MTESNKITPKEFIEIINKTDKENPKKEDLRELREALRANPALWKIAGDMADNAARNMISKVRTTPALKESLKTAWKEMQKELEGENKNPLEKLLIQQVVMSWFRLQLIEYKYTEMMNQSITLTLGRYWEGRLNAAQRRHLRAVETLARVRRILSRTPSVQVNIATQGGQQVNVAGEVNTGKK
jgi:hypothetical protein